MQCGRAAASVASRSWALGPLLRMHHAGHTGHHHGQVLCLVTSSPEGKVREQRPRRVLWRAWKGHSRDH